MDWPYIPARQTLDAGSLDLSTGSSRQITGQQLLDMIDTLLTRFDDAEQPPRPPHKKE